MSFITPIGWTRHEGFPQITGNGLGATLADEFYTTYDLTDIYAKLPAMDSSYDEESITPDIATLRLSSYSINPTASKNHAIITLNYQPTDANGGGGGGGGGNQVVAEYFLETGALEKPLESFPDYVTKWNYHLASKNDTSQPKPTDWDKKTTIKLTETEWMWVKERSELASDWNVIEAKEKNGKESYILPSPVVQERKNYPSKDSASEAAAVVGTRVAPAELFGIVGGDWLVMSASVQKDGRSYLLERTFQYADDWDGDLYDEAT